MDGCLQSAVLSSICSGFESAVGAVRGPRTTAAGRAWLA